MVISACIVLILSTGHVKKSSDKTTKSASLPGSMDPLISSSKAGDWSVRLVNSSGIVLNEIKFEVIQQ